MSTFAKHLEESITAMNMAKREELQREELISQEVTRLMQDSDNREALAQQMALAKQKGETVL